MAVNESRSLNESLDEGSTDGKYRKVRPHTTVAPGQGDELVRANRRSLHPYWNYDFIDTEAVAKVNPGSNGAAKGRTPQYGTPVFGIEAATQQYN
jgi:hypothetical protein